MIERPMVRRNPTRYLAPIALVAVAAGTYVVVHANLTTNASHARHASRASDLPKGKYENHTYYTVQPGDSLSAISAKTGVPMRMLQSLNPTVDRSTLQPGNVLRLRR
jgi:LysM repeat protein